MLQIPEAAQWLPQNTPAILEARGPLMLPEVARELGLNETQVVEAVVRVRGERMELFLNGRAIEVPPGWRMSPGQTVWLTAHATTQGLWVLRQHGSAAIAQRALNAAAARAGVASGTSAASAASAAASTAPSPPSVAVPDAAQAAAAERVAKAKVVLQARSEGQDPLHALAKKAQADAAAPGLAAKPLRTADVAAGAPNAWRSPLAADGKPMTAQEALAMARNARAPSGEGLTASTARADAAVGAAMPRPNPLNPQAAAPLGTPGMGKAAAGGPVARPSTDAAGPLQTWPQWASARDGESLTRGLAAHSSLPPKWASVWSQPAPLEWVDWAQASPRVRELALHPSGMQALMHLWQPDTLAALLQNPALAQWAQSIQRERLSMRRPEAATIKQAVEQVLQPQEARLASGHALQAGAPDVRALLGDVLRHLKGLGDAAHSAPLQAALSDVEASQLDHLRGLHQREWSLQCVLPFADAPPVQLQLQREAADAQPGSPWRHKWWVNLYTESDRLGQVWMRSGIAGGSDVEMDVWATREHVVLDARARAAELRELLADAELTLAHFQVHHGEKPAAPPRSPPPHGAVWDSQA